MKKKLKLLTIGLLSTALTLGVGFTIYQNATPNKVEATQYLDDYAAYTYSGNYYKNINFSASYGMDGELRRALTSLIKPNGYYTYSGSGDTTISYALQYADEDPNNKNNMIYLYTRNSVTKNAASSWNREHVWCQSLSNNNWGKSQGGTDVLHLRPTYQSTNSSRGNTPYGEVSKSYAKYYNGMLYGYCENANEYFMPIDQVRGDVARTVMYLWVTYNNTTKPLNIESVFESYDTLLRWHTLDRPDVLEGNRNNWCETKSKQGNRNPFVDHPELAWKIFGDKASASVKATCMAAYPEDGGIDPVDPTNISLNRTKAELKVGDKLQLTATLQPNGATGNISWYTNNYDVATVDSNGSVTAIGEGTATITAKYSSTVKAECTVTVTESSTGDEGEFDIANSISIGDTVYLASSYASAQYNGPSASGADAIGTFANFTTKPDYNTCPLEVHEGNANNTYAFELKSGSYKGKYLAYSGSKNSLSVADSISDISSWNVSFDEGNATITNYDATGRTIWWNKTSPRFCCYTGKTAGDGFKNVQLWKMTSTPVTTFDLDDSLNEIESVVELHGSNTIESDVSTDSIIFRDEGYSDSTKIESFNVGDVLVETTANGSNSPAYFNNGEALRVYGSNTLTFTCNSGNITNIEFEWTHGKGSIGLSNVDEKNGEFDGTSWNGNAKTVSIMRGSGTGHVRITKITVTYGSMTLSSIDNVSLRFGAEMPKSTWNEIAENCTINDYGVMLVRKTTLENYELENHTIEEAFDNELALAAVSMGSGNAPFESGDNYVFKAIINISNYETWFVAAPFIVVDGIYHFLEQKSESAKDLAGKYLDGHIDCELTELALKIIAGRA